jgi:hypothetical protein
MLSPAVEQLIKEPWVWRTALLILLGSAGLVALRQAMQEHGYGLPLLLFMIFALLLWLVLYRNAA